MAKRLMDEAREVFRTLHYSYRTEATYLKWIKRFIKYHGNRHPRDLGPAEIQQFLTDLATVGRVSASTQNQALSALLFRYKKILLIDLPFLDEIVRTNLPEALVPKLKEQIDRVRVVLERDRDQGPPGVSLLEAIDRKYVNAALSWRWQYIFPSRNYAFIQRNMRQRRHHTHPYWLSRALKIAVEESGINKRATAHAF